MYSEYVGGVTVSTLGTAVTRLLEHAGDVPVCRHVLRSKIYQAMVIRARRHNCAACPEPVRIDIAACTESNYLRMLSHQSEPQRRRRHSPCRHDPLYRTAVADESEFSTQSSLSSRLVDRFCFSRRQGNCSLQRMMTAGLWIEILLRSEDFGHRCMTRSSKQCA